MFYSFTAKPVYNDHPGTLNLWPLLTGSRCSEVALCYKKWKWDPEMMVVVGRSSFFGGGRYSGWSWSLRSVSINAEFLLSIIIKINTFLSCCLLRTFSFDLFVRPGICLNICGGITVNPTCVKSETFKARVVVVVAAGAGAVVVVVVRS